MPQVGFVGAWMDPEDPAVWSGVPKGVMDGLRGIGAFAGFYDATPLPSFMRLAQARRMPAGSNSGWTLTPEMRLAAALSNVVHRRRSQRSAEAWVNPVAGFGRPVRGRVAALLEITPEQLRRTRHRFPNAFWNNLSDRRFEAICRQQTRLLRYASVCCTAGSWAAESLVLDHGVDPRKVRVVGYGRNVHVAPEADKDWSRPRFLFVGRDWNRKNGDAVVRAFDRLRTEVTNARLDLVGRHPRIDVDGVVGHGEVDRSTSAGRRHLEGLFRGATCFVMPSHVEAFGIAYVEAAAAGLGSIGTTIGGTTDSIGSGGLRVDPDDEIELLAAMREMSNPHVAKVTGSRALERSEAFTWTAVARRLVAALAPGALPDDPLPD